MVTTDSIIQKKKRFVKQKYNHPDFTEKSLLSAVIRFFIKKSSYHPQLRPDINVRAESSGTLRPDINVRAESSSTLKRAV